MSAEPLVVASSSIEHRRPRLGGWLMRAGFGGFVGFPGLIVTILAIVGPETADASVPLSVLIFFLAGLGLLVAPFVSIAGAVLAALSLPLRNVGVLRADGQGLVVVQGGKERHLARSAIEGGIVLPGTLLDGKRPRVELYLRRGVVLTAEVPDGIAAHRILDRLGIDVSRRRVAVLSGSAYRPLATGCLSLPVVCFLLAIPLGYFITEYPSADWPVLVFAWAVMLTMFFIVRLARPREIIVGSDGLRIRRGGFDDRWIPHSRVCTVEEQPRSLFLVVGEAGRPGERVEVATGDPSFILALAGRLRLAIALGSNGADGPPVGAELDPAGKSFTEWKDKLQSLLLHAGYRKSAVTYEELVAVVDDPDLPPGQRLGAAMAIGIAKHPDGRERIRVAAEACADDAMKYALEEAAEGELDERTLRRVLD
ncbi:hypothetical protein [Polyangium mundeleinium]|uniref:Uncharacterized protein n=1 Tax=Polyangium mundeleinium TaxID=2995306 RepID=A0ABT5EDM3_9BACT|nr:hypothetical protein [Polyangium mundeleinium]MDC0739922.1 hypothetical protein [Polyangium mundeleinium]